MRVTDTLCGMTMSRSRSGIRNPTPRSIKRSWGQERWKQYEAVIEAVGWLKFDQGHLGWRMWKFMRGFGCLLNRRSLAYSLRSSVDQKLSLLR